MDTDTKLAILASLAPDSAFDSLLEVLVDAGGDVELARTRLASSSSISTSTSTSTSSKQLQAPVTRFFNVSSSSETSPPRKRVRTHSGTLSKLPPPVLHLYTPATIAQYTPCTFTPNFLPPDLAEPLLSFLLDESVSWQPNLFRLFNREVSSPHTTSFYVNPDKVDAFTHTYRYNGAAITDVRRFNDTMMQVQALIEEVVNKEISDRGFLKHQTHDKWVADVAFCNRYDGPTESVGFHSDRLTYIGPQPVIASLSLGVTREFRLRPMAPPSENSGTQTYSLHLPHNSLLIMHAPCQEKFKHSVIPARKVDPHPIAGNVRLNLTYRMFRQEFSPENSPTCKCGITMVLRCVSKKQDSLGKYFWSCASAYQQETGCDLFIWQPVTDDGNPVKLQTYDYSSKPQTESQPKSNDT
ncbi:GRF zinc finger protein [Myxozyma melibiosi]|uniref:GRF zinc finger protein n=1 Tax=Myxozyma melibiosi TaxID=54550 RepID=A0ABR1F0L8_9ASCO